MAKYKPLAIAPRTRVKLPAADYYKFRTLVNDVHAIAVEAQAAAKQFQQRAAEADAKARTFFAALGKTHGFDDTQTWSWNDETCEIAIAPKP